MFRVIFKKKWRDPPDPEKEGRYEDSHEEYRAFDLDNDSLGEWLTPTLPAFLVPCPPVEDRDRDEEGRPIAIPLLPSITDEEWEVVGAERIGD